MPRKAKRKRKHKNGLDEAKARYWCERIRAAETAKADYLAVASEVMEYFKANHEALYTNDHVRTNFMDFKDGACVSVPKVAQARNTLGPHLYPTNPSRVVTPRTGDGVLLAHARVLQCYLNYTPGEAGLVRQKRRAIDDGLLRGRTFLGPVWDDTLEVVTSRYVSSLDVLIDPDARSMEEAQWIAIRREEPLWSLKRNLPKSDHWRLKHKPRSSDPTSQIESDDFADSRRRDEDDPSPSNVLVTYFEVYSKMGCGVRGEGFGMDAEADLSRQNDQVDFVRLDVSMDYTVPLYEGEWEVPVYLDSEWPLVEWDPVETVDSLWPVSPMGQVLSLQKAIDLLTTLALNSAKHRSKVIVLGNAELDARAQEQIKSGDMAEYVSVKQQPGGRLVDQFHTLSFGQAPQELAMEREFYERELETTTGVTSILTGGQQHAQDRSATASQLRAQGANTRLMDLKNRVEEWSARVARLEAIYVSLNLEAEDVERCVSVDDIGMFMVRLEVPGGAVVPLRDRGDEYEEEPVDEGGDPPERPLTMAQICPDCATFFSSEEEAAEALMILMQDLQSGAAFEGPDGARIMSLVEAIGYQFDDPASLIAPVTVEDVWREIAGMTPKEIMREYSYELATGSMPMLDPARREELTQTLLNQVAPVTLQVGDYDAFNAILNEYYEANEVPQNMRVTLTPPPPPPPPPGAAGQPAPEAMPAEVPA